MVLPAPAAHAAPAPDSAGWIDRVRHLVRLRRDGALILVDKACDARLGELVRALLPDHPELDVHVDARAVLEAPEGAVVVYAPEEQDFDWLNLKRPVFAERRLRVILWCSAETSGKLARQAPDFFDWISHRVECPPGVPRFAVLGLRAALCARAPGILWQGGPLEDVFREAFPRRKLVMGGAMSDFDHMEHVLADTRGQWVCWELNEPADVRAFAFLSVYGGRRTKSIGRNPNRTSAPGFWSLHGQTMALRASLTQLTAAGCDAGGRVASLLDFEPEGVDVVGRLLLAGASRQEIERRLMDATDPGIVVAEMALASGILALEDVARHHVTAPVLRRFGRDPRVVELRRRALSALTTRILNGASVDPDEVEWWGAWSRHPNARFVGEMLTDAMRARVNASAELGALSRRLRLAMEERLAGAGQLTVHELTDLRGQIEGLVGDQRKLLASAVGGDHPDVISGLRVQAALLLNLGNYQASESILRELLAHDERSADPEALVTTLQDLGQVLAAQGRYEEAEPLMRRALALHPGAADELQLRALLAVVQAALRRPEAHRTAERALEGLSRAPGRDSPMMQQIIGILRRIAEPPV